MTGGGSTSQETTIPDPSAEELALRDMQVELIQKAATNLDRTQAIRNLIEPIQLRSAGLNPQAVLSQVPQIKPDTLPGEPFGKDRTYRGIQVPGDIPLEFAKSVIDRTDFFLKKTKNVSIEKALEEFQLKKPDAAKEFLEDLFVTIRESQRGNFSKVKPPLSIR